MQSAQSRFIEDHCAAQHRRAAEALRDPRRAGQHIRPATRDPDLAEFSDPQRVRKATDQLRPRRQPPPGFPSRAPHPWPVHRDQAQPALLRQVMRKPRLQARARPAVVIHHRLAAGIAILIPSQPPPRRNLPEPRLVDGRQVAVEIQGLRSLIHGAGRRCGCLPLLPSASRLGAPTRRSWRYSENDLTGSRGAFLPVRSKVIPARRPSHRSIPAWWLRFRFPC